MGQATDGLVQLRECVDSVIAIPNDRLLQSVARNTLVSEAFRVADDVLRQAVQGISDIIMVPAQINLDFADVRASRFAKCHSRRASPRRPNSGVLLGSRGR